MAACRRARRGDVEVNHSYPVLLHFNGNGLEKHKLNAVVRRLSWPNETTQADVWSSYVRDADRGSAAPLRETCDEWLPLLACKRSVSRPSCSPPLHFTLCLPVQRALTLPGKRLSAPLTRGVSVGRRAGQRVPDHAPSRGDRTERGLGIHEIERVRCEPRD